MATAQDEGWRQLALMPGTGGGGVRDGKRRGGALISKVQGNRNWSLTQINGKVVAGGPQSAHVDGRALNR